MTDCFFVAVSGSRLDETLPALETSIKKGMKDYRQSLVDLGNKQWVVENYCHFSIQSYTVMPEMVPVHGGLVAAGSQQQFTTQYTVIVLVIVDYKVHQ